MDVSSRALPWIQSLPHLSSVVASLPEYPFLEFGRTCEPAERAAGDDPSEPPASSITGGSNRQNIDKSLEIGGVDWFEVSLWVNWDLAKLEQLKTRLALAKSCSCAFDASVDFELAGGEVVSVRPAGRKFGPVLAEWIIETQGMQIAIVDAATPESGRCNMFLQIGSIALMSAGIKVLLEGFSRLCEEWGFNVEKSSVSRIDLCVDLPGVPMKWFAEPFWRDWYITRATKDRIERENRAVTGIYIGKGDIILRIYDKINELDGQPLKVEVMRDARYFGDPAEATRVEFQLRGKALKKKCDGNNSIEDVLARLGALANYLCVEWIRFTADEPDRENHNQHRAETSALWKFVQTAFAIAYPIELPRGVPKKRRPFAPLLVKQALGCMRSAAAAMGVKYSGRDGFMELMWRLVNYVVKDWKTEGIKWERAETRVASMLPLAHDNGDDTYLSLVPASERWQELFYEWQRSQYKDGVIPPSESRKLQGHASLGLALAGW